MQTKRLILILTVMIWGLGVRAQSGPQVTAPEVLAQYPEGNSGLYDFINRQMTFTAADREQHIEGEVIVTFVVHTDGKLSDVEIKKGLSPDINDRIVGVIGKMPEWRPARTGGEWITSRYSLAMVVQASDGRVKPLF